MGLWRGRERDLVDGRLVGYCSSCRFFRFHDEEADTLHPQLRFGRCRLRIVAVPACCERYQVKRPPGGR